MPEENFDPGLYEAIGQATTDQSAVTSQEQTTSPLTKITDIIGLIGAPATMGGSLLGVSKPTREAATAQIPGIGAAAGSFFGGPIGSGAGAAAGRSYQEILNQLGGLLDVGIGPTMKGIQGVAQRPELLQEQISTAPERVKPFLGDVATQAGGAVAFDALLGGAGTLGKKILGPIGTKIKGVFPSNIIKTANKFLTSVSPRFNAAVGATKSTKLDISNVITELERIRNDAIYRNPVIYKKLTKAADEVISRTKGYGTNPNPGQAFDLSLGFADDVFGEAEKELKKRGVEGVMKHDMMRAAGSRLKELAKQGLETFDPSIRTVFDQWSAAKSIIRMAERPSTGISLGGITTATAASLGTLLGMVTGNPSLGVATAGPGVALGLATLLKESPYYNFLAKQAAGLPLSVLGSKATRTATQPLLQNLLQIGQQ